MARDGWYKKNEAYLKADVKVHDSSIIDDDVMIGDGTKIWHFCHVSKGATIGRFCSIGQNVFIAPGVSIGDQCKIQNNVSVYEGVTLEDNVFCGPSCVFTNVLKPRSRFPVHGTYEKTLVKSGATIGANATIVCGITIGTDSFIAAGAVVTRDVPDYAVVAGVPGQIVGWMCGCGKSLDFNNYSYARCPGCKREFDKIKDVVVIRSLKGFNG